MLRQVEVRQDNNRSLLYGDRYKRALVRRPQNPASFEALERGLIILTMAGYKSPALFDRGLAACGADLLHYCDNRQGQSPQSSDDIDDKLVTCHSLIAAEAYERYRANKRVGLYRLRLIDLSPLQIASRRDNHSCLARAFCYVEDATDYQSFRESSLWPSDVSQAIASLLHAGQEAGIHADDALELISRRYRENLDFWAPLA